MWEGSVLLSQGTRDTERRGQYITVWIRCYVTAAGEGIHEKLCDRRSLYSLTSDGFTLVTFTKEN